MSKNYFIDLRETFFFFSSGWNGKDVCDIQDVSTVSIWVHIGTYVYVQTPISSVTEITEYQNEVGIRGSLLNCLCNGGSPGIFYSWV